LASRRHTSIEWTRFDLESSGGLYCALAGLHQLLCHANGGSPRCHGHGEISRPYTQERASRGLDRNGPSRSSRFGCAESMAEAAARSCEFYVGSVPRCGPCKVRPRVLVGDEFDPAAYLLDSHQAAGPNGEHNSRSAEASECVARYQRGERGLPPRIDESRKVDAVVRFVSFEPLLGSVAANAD
jgi:hypothetical protein